LKRRIFRRILVPHDLSAPASDALGVAAELARARGGKLKVVRVLRPVESLAGISPPGHPVWTPSAEDVRREQDLLRETVSAVLGPGPLGFDVDVEVLVGDPLTEIINLARSADSIVMATQGLSGLAHLLIGSFAEKIVRHSPIPVLTVRPEAVARMRRGDHGTERTPTAGSHVRRIERSRRPGGYVKPDSLRRLPRG